MNAIELIREVCAIIGQPQPNSIIGSADRGVQQLGGLLNKEGRTLSERYAWEALTREQTFVTTASEDQGALTSLITDGQQLRFVINDTMFNRTRNEPVCGPSSSVDWQIMKMLNHTGPYTEYRIRGRRLLFSPAPAAGETIAFEYVSKSWATSEDGATFKTSITNDNDVLLLDDEVMLAGVEWRWRKSKGLEYAEDFNAYEILVKDAMTRDGTKRTLSLGGASGERRHGIPSGSWDL